MVNATELALAFVQGRDRRALADDLMLQFALVRAVEIIGEAASKVSADGRATMPQLPWGAIVGTRNRLVHAYFDIDLDVLWATVEHDLPELLAQLKTVRIS